MPEFLRVVQGKLIVSCQAQEGDAFHGPENMARFARAAVEGGAAAIRANGPADVRAIRQAVPAPVLGIQKVPVDDGRVLITPSFEDALALVEAGAAAVALDCTARGQRYGALERLRRIKAELGVPVAADIATLEEALAAAHAGADAVLSTMRGYTLETARVTAFEPAFIKQLVSSVEVPVIAEGRIWTLEQARAALENGAHAVVVGTAITRPREITAHFASALAEWAGRQLHNYIGLDLGGTNIKFGVVSGQGEFHFSGAVPTPAREGPEAVLERVKQVARECLERAQGLAIRAVGVATGGWVNPSTGEVIYATGNLPEWTGMRLGAELESTLGLPVFVENDANALAVAEKHFGAARGADNFICLTLGTGVGGGCYAGGRLNRGGHFLANALGHVLVEPGGLPCTCGQRGCLEVYANAAALLRYAGETRFASAKDVITTAHVGDSASRQAIRTLVGYLARGCASLVHVLDPELLVLGGGLAEGNQLLLEWLPQELDQRTAARHCRRLEVRLSALGYCGGVAGAAAVARERIRADAR